MAKRKPKAKKQTTDRAIDVSTKSAPADSAVTATPERLLNLSPEVTRILICVALALVVGLFFSPVLGNEIVRWDDDITLYRNPNVQGLDLQRLHWMFTDVRYSMRYKPLSWLSIALIHSISGLKAFAYHFVSLLFHAVNAALVFLLFRKMMERRNGIAIGSPAVLSLFAVLGALLWALHPLRVEVVARITDMTYCQSTFFVLVSLLCYLRFVETEGAGKTKRSWYWSSVVTFGLAMGTYPFVFGYPVVLLAMDFYLLRRFGTSKSWWHHPRAAQIWLEKVPFLVLSSLLLVTFQGRLNPTGIWKAQELQDQFGFFSHVMQAFYVWAYFVWKPFAPFDLSPVYTTLVWFDPNGWLFIGSALFVVGLTCLLFFKRRQWPLVWVIWICHLVLLIPALGLTEHPHYASDRYSYVPSIALSALLIGGLWYVCRLAKSYAWPVVAGVILVASLGTMTARQIPVWHDTVTLFQYVIAKLGDNPYRLDLYGRLGDHYFNLGKYDEAITAYQQLVPLMPDNAKLRNNLGILLMRRSRLDEALVQLKEAVRLDPQSPSLRWNLGDLFNRLNRYEEAVVEFEETLRLRPGDAEAHNGLGFALMKQGKVSKAITHFQEAVKLQPQNAEMRSNLEAALRSLNTVPADSGNR